MREQLISTSPQWQSVESGWDWFFSIVLAGLLLFLPFSLGVVEPWSELFVVGIAVMLSVALILRSWLEARFRLVWTWAYVPLLGILALSLVQLMPLPQALVGVVSGESLQLREQLLGNLMPPAGENLTLSLYAHETAHDLRMALVFVAVFVTVASVFQSKSQIKRALWGVFLLGCGEAALAILQILTLSHKIHWMFAERGSVVTSGSFINYSHFCQFINLALGAGVALLLIQMREDSRRDRGQISRLVDLRGERYLRPLTGLVLCVVAVFTSMSRNGAISLLIASGIIAVALYRRGVLSTRGWVLAIVPWTVVLLVVFTSFDRIYDRFASLQGQGDLGSRWELTSGTLDAWQDFPVLGTGLGTHEYLFPLYDTATNARMAEHADNDWAQLLEEFGLLGGLAVVSFVVSIFVVAIRLMWKGKTALSTAAFGLCVGLLATAWHSLSDFGQHLPGVFVLTATISGLIVAIARYERRKTLGADQVEAYQAATPSWSRSKLFSVPMAAIALVAAVWGLHGAFTSYRADLWANNALAMEQHIASEFWSGAEQDFVDLLVAAGQAAEYEPDNVRHGYMLNLYRWQSLSRQQDPETGEILLSKQTLSFVTRIVEELAQLRLVCPVFGPIYGLEGELRTFVLGEESGKQLISKAARLTPYHAETNFVAGQLAASEGRWEEAKEFFTRTVELAPEQFRLVATVCVNDYDRLSLAESLAGNDYNRLVVLSDLLAKAQDQSVEKVQSAKRLQARALTRLRELVSTGNANARQVYSLATVALRNENYEQGITLLRQALTQDYGQAGWRVLLARTLLEQGDYDQALHEAKIVLRLEPRSKAAADIVNKAGDMRSEAAKKQREAEDLENETQIGVN